MAFATANVKADVHGSTRVTKGDWSGSQADAAGTITVTGGRIYGCLFTSQDASGEFMPAPVRITVSTSGNLTTISVYNLADVTTGRFIIWHD